MKKIGVLKKAVAVLLAFAVLITAVPVTQVEVAAETAPTVAPDLVDYAFGETSNGGAKLVVYASYSDINQYVTTDGYYTSLEVSVSKLDGTVVDTQTATLYSSVYYVASFASVKLKQSYVVTLTPYATDYLTGAKLTGPSTSFYAVPQPKTTSDKDDISKNSIKLKWKKVKGAKSYTIYVAKSTKKDADTSELNWKKVTKTKKTSYTLKKLGKKKINTYKYYYYVKIVTTAKVNGEKVSSTDYACSYYGTTY